MFIRLATGLGRSDLLWKAALNKAHSESSNYSYLKHSIHHSKNTKRFFFTTFLANASKLLPWLKIGIHMMSFNQSECIIYRMKLILNSVSFIILAPYDILCSQFFVIRVPRDLILSKTRPEQKPTFEFPNLFTWTRALKHRVRSSLCSVKISSKLFRLKEKNGLFFSEFRTLHWLKKSLERTRVNFSICDPWQTRLQATEL